MKKKEDIGLDFEVDKLTNSIENVRSGDRFQTVVSILNESDIELINQDKKWQFDWKSEFIIPEREVYKLAIQNNSKIIQGLVSLQLKTDHIYMHLLENAPFNKGKNKVYSGVAGNLVAFACKRSFQLGYDGYVSFLSKSNLVDHYEQTLKAVHIGGRVMIINTEAALRLINRYFKDSDI